MNTAAAPHSPKQLKLDIPQRELCPNVMQSDATGENQEQCRAECYYICFRHEDPIEACTKSCMREQGCNHEPQYVSDEAVSA